MDAVKAFNGELSSLYEQRPPISKAKMTSITRTAIKAIKFYKHVVQSVEKFIQKCKPEYKVPGLYVIDSIVRQSRHQFTPEKDVFAPRFARNIQTTFLHLFSCASDDKGKIVRVLNLWQKNNVFTPEVIQPLLDMASLANKNELVTPSNGVQAKTPPLTNQQRTTSKPSPVKDPGWLTGDLGNNVVTSTPQPKPVASTGLDPNIVHQLQNLQTLLLENKLDFSTLTAKKEEPVKFDKKLLDFDYEDEDDEPSPQQVPPPTQAQPSLPTLDSLQQILSNPEVLRQLQNLQQQMSTRQQQAEMEEKMRKLQEMRHQEEEFDKHLAQTLPNLPFASECDFKPSSTTSQNLDPVMIPPPSNNAPVFSTGQQNLPFRPLEPTEQGDYDERRLIRPPSTGDNTSSGQGGGGGGADCEVIDLVSGDSTGRGSRSPGGSRSRKRDKDRDRDSSPRRSRRSRSRSRSRRSRRSRSRDRDRDRSERDREADRERDRERKRRGLPPLKKEHLAVCSTTLWVGHLSKLIQQEELSDTFGEYGEIEKIILIHPRGCAFICMNRRQDAAKALNHLKHYKLGGRTLTLAWAPGKGLKDKEWKEYWQVENGVSYIPWDKLSENTDFARLEEGGVIDEETVPEWLKDYKNMGPKPTEGDYEAQNQESEAGDGADDNDMMQLDMMQQPPPPPPSSSADLPAPPTTMPGFIPLPDPPMGPPPNAQMQGAPPMPPPPMGLLPPPFGMPPNVGLLGPMGPMGPLGMGNVPLGVPPPMMMPPAGMRLGPPFNQVGLMGEKGKGPPMPGGDFSQMINPFGLPLPTMPPGGLPVQPLAPVQNPSPTPFQIQEYFASPSSNIHPSMLKNPTVYSKESVLNTVMSSKNSTVLEEMGGEPAPSTSTTINSKESPRRTFSMEDFLRDSFSDHQTNPPLKSLPSSYKPILPLQLLILDKQVLDSGRPLPHISTPNVPLGESHTFETESNKKLSKPCELQDISKPTEDLDIHGLLESSLILPADPKEHQSVTSETYIRSVPDVTDGSAPAFSSSTIHPSMTKEPTLRQCLNPIVTRKKTARLEEIMKEPPAPIKINSTETSRRPRAFSMGDFLRDSFLSISHSCLPPMATNTAGQNKGPSEMEVDELEDTHIETKENIPGMNMVGGFSHPPPGMPFMQPPPPFGPGAGNNGGPPSNGVKQERERSQSKEPSPDRRSNDPRDSSRRRDRDLEDRERNRERDRDRDRERDRDRDRKKDDDRDSKRRRRESPSRGRDGREGRDRDERRGPPGDRRDNWRDRGSKGSGPAEPWKREDDRRDKRNNSPFGHRDGPQFPHDGPPSDQPPVPRSERPPLLPRPDGPPMFPIRPPGPQEFGGRGPGFGPPGPDRDEEREFRGPGGPPGDFRGPPGGPPPGFHGPGEFEGPDFHEFNEGPPEFHEGRPDFHGRGPEFHGPPEFHRGGPDFPGRGGFFGPRGPRGMVSQGRAPLLRSPNGPPMFGPRGPGPMGMRGPPHGPPGGPMEGPNFMGPPPSHGGPQLRGFQGMRLRGSRFPLLQTPPGGRQWDEFPRMGDEMVRPPRPPREERKSRWGNSDDREDDGPRDMEMGGGDFDGLDGSADTAEVKGSDNNEEKPVSALLEENFQTAEVNKSPADDKPLSAILEDVSKPTGDPVKEDKPLSELLEENFKPDENKPINDDKPLSAMLEEKLDVPEPSKPLSEILEHALPEEKVDKPLSAILEQSSEANKPSGGNFDMFDASSEPEVKIREEPVPQQEFNEPVASFMDDLPPPKDEMPAQEYVDVPSREEIAPHKEEIASHREDMPPHEDRQETPPHTEEAPSHREDIHEEPPSKHEGSPVHFDSPKPAEDAPSPNMADPVQSEPTPAE